MVKKVEELTQDEDFLMYYDLEEKHKHEKQSSYELGIERGIEQGIEQGITKGSKYNVPISVDTIRRRYPIKWTYQEGVESLIVDTKIWVF